MTTFRGNKLLVTGGTGLVGEALSSELLRDGEIRQKFEDVLFLSSREADLTDFNRTGYVFKKYKPDYVVHLAAKVGGLYANMKENDLFYSENMKINRNVLFWANEMGVKKCISCLSTCIFPDDIHLPLDENKIHLGPPHHSNVGYSLAKRYVDTLNKLYNEKNKNSLFTSIIPTNIYGENDNFSLSDAHVIPCLIHKAYISVTTASATCVKEASLKVLGSGKPLRQFLYSRDLARIIYWLLENYSDPDPLIICPDEEEEVTIGQVAELISSIYIRKLGVDLKVEFDTRHSDGQYRKTASNLKLRTLNKEFNFTPLSVGLEEAISWFISKYPDVRK